MVKYIRRDELFSSSYLYSVYQGFGTIHYDGSNNEFAIFVTNGDGSRTAFFASAASPFTYTSLDINGVLNGGTVETIGHQPAGGGTDIDRWENVSVEILDLQNVSGHTLIERLMEGAGDEIVSSEFDDELRGGDGGGDIYYLGTGAGLDNVWLGAATLARHYVLDYTDADYGVTIDLVNELTTYHGVAAFGDILHNAQANNIDIRLSPGEVHDDTIRHNENGGYVFAGAGDDLVTGYGGGDDLDGHLGIDTVDYSWFPAVNSSSFRRRINEPLVIDLSADGASGFANYDCSQRLAVGASLPTPCAISRM